LDENNSFTVVSCSRMVQVKRIDKIIDTLAFINFPIKWIHFGDGDLMEETQRLSKKLSSNSNVSFDLKGNIANDLIMDFYKKNSVSYISLRHVEKFKKKIKIKLVCLKIENTNNLRNQ